MRFVLRMTSLLLLALAVFAGVLDSIRSVARSGVEFTSLDAAWTSLSPQSLARAEGAFSTVPYGNTWMTGFDWVLLQPAFAVLLAISLLFWMAGYRKVRPAGRFSA